MCFHNLRFFNRLFCNLRFLKSEIFANDFVTPFDNKVTCFSGCRITVVTPGTKLVSKNVKYSTAQKTGLAVGCYRVKEPGKDTERILIIRDENNSNDSPAVVKEIDKKAQNSNSKKKNAKFGGRKGSSTEDSDPSEVEISDSDDDSDDPSWGRKRKKKNDPKGKKRKRKF